jgi:hypothetical protein
MTNFINWWLSDAFSKNRIAIAVLFYLIGYIVGKS